MRVTFLLPALNEAEGIAGTLARIPKAALRTAGHEVHVLVVDGASTDGTSEKARAAGAEVLVEPRRGYGRAYKAGFAHAQGDVVITGDADDSYPFEDTARILDDFARRGLDFATVDRYAGLGQGAMSPQHRFGNRVLSWTARGLFGLRLRDSQSGMWVLSRRAIGALPFEAMSNGMGFSEEVKIRAFRHGGLRSAELSGGYRARLGTAKLASWRDGMSNLAYLWRLRLRRTRTRPENP